MVDQRVLADHFVPLVAALSCGNAEEVLRDPHNPFLASCEFRNMLEVLDQELHTHLSSNGFRYATHPLLAGLSWEEDRGRFIVRYKRKMVVAWFSDDTPPFWAAGARLACWWRAGVEQTLGTMRANPDPIRAMTEYARCKAMQSVLRRELPQSSN